MAWDQFEAAREAEATARVREADATSRAHGTAHANHFVRARTRARVPRDMAEPDDRVPESEAAVLVADSGTQQGSEQQQETLPDPQTRAALSTRQSWSTTTPIPAPEAGFNHNQEAQDFSEPLPDSTESLPLAAQSLEKLAPESETLASE